MSEQPTQPLTLGPTRWRRWRWIVRLLATLAMLIIVANSGWHHLLDVGGGMALGASLVWLQHRERAS